MRSVRPSNPTVCICKELILHPIQIAQALEHGATGILLIACVVGGDLQFLLDACTLMGTEALIEVHTPEELKYALSLGGVNFILNRWDRLTGVLYPEQARLMAAMFPMNTVNLVAGGVQSLKEVGEFGLCGYDGVVIGRHIAEVSTVLCLLLCVC